MISLVLLVIITVFIPPLGVFFLTGCGADLLINLALTILGYFPGHIHAFYIEYVYYKRREQAQHGILDQRPAPGIYSSRVQAGGNPRVKQQQQAVQTAAPVIPAQNQAPFEGQMQAAPYSDQAQYGTMETGTTAAPGTTMTGAGKSGAAPYLA